MTNWWDKAEKYVGSKTPIGRGAQKVTNAVGGKGITDYIAGKGSKMGLAKGVANVGMVVATGGAGVGRAVVKRGLVKAVAKDKARRAKRAINSKNVMNGPKGKPDWR